MFSLLDSININLKHFLVNFLTLSINLFLVCHVIACMTIVTEGWDNGRDKYSVYMDSLYFVYMTATVIGNGSLTINLKQEQDFQGRMLLGLTVVYFSIFFAGYTFACINQIIDTLRYIDSQTDMEVP